MLTLLYLTCHVLLTVITMLIVGKHMGLVGKIYPYTPPKKPVWGRPWLSLVFASYQSCCLSVCLFVFYLHFYKYMIHHWYKSNQHYLLKSKYIYLCSLVSVKNRANDKISLSDSIFIRVIDLTMKKRAKRT